MFPVNDPLFGQVKVEQDQFPEFHAPGEFFPLWFGSVRKDVPFPFPEPFSRPPLVSSCTACPRTYVVWFPESPPSFDGDRQSPDGSRPLQPRSGVPGLAGIFPRPGKRAAQPDRHPGNPDGSRTSVSFPVCLVCCPRAGVGIPGYFALSGLDDEFKGSGGSPAPGRTSFFRRDFSRSNLATGTLFSVISIILLFGYAIFGAYILGKGFSPPIDSLLTAFYFSVVTMATVGYGDIVPKTDDARMFVVSLIILGISVFTASLSTVVLPMMNDRVRHLLMGGRRKMSRKNHYILVGTGGLAANVFAELNDRNLPVTLIVNRRIEEPPWNTVDQVIGDPADTEVLKEAGILAARALLSLLENDGENAFVVLAARASGTEAKTVVSVRDRVNLARIRTVRPDMILAMDVIGAQILGMALSGEPVDGDQLLKKVLFAEADDPEKATEGR